MANDFGEGLPTRDVPQEQKGQPLKNKALSGELLFFFPYLNQLALSSNDLMKALHSLRIFAMGHDQDFPKYEIFQIEDKSEKGRKLEKERVFSPDYSREDSLRHHRRPFKLFGALEHVAHENHLRAEQVVMIADFLNDLFSVVFINEGGEKGGIKRYFRLSLGPQRELFNQMIQENIDLGNYQRFSELVGEKTGEKVIWDKPQSQKVDKSLITEVRRMITVRRKLTLFFYGLAVQQYLRGQTNEERGRPIHLIHLLSGFNMGEDIRRQIDPQLPKIGEVYSLSQIQQALNYLESILGYKSIGHEFGIAGER